MISFEDKVYNLAKQIPKGKVSTYRLIAEGLHSKAYRAVGQALRHNPYAPKVPCHRVVANDGSIGGFGGKKSGSAIRRKIALLAKEGVKVKANRVENFSSVLHRFRK